MDELRRSSQIVLVLSVAFIIVIAIILLMIKPIGDRYGVMAQESIRQVQWVQVNPPPGVEGPCWGFYEDEIGVGESLAGVWCK